MLEVVGRAVRRCGYRDGPEEEMHNCIALALLQAGFAFTREYELGPRERVDFFLDCGIAIECKVDGGTQEVGRQLLRYAAAPQVTALILATARARHRMIPEIIGDKPVRVVLFQALP